MTVMVTKLVCPSVTMRFTSSHLVVTLAGHKLAGALADGDNVSITMKLPCGAAHTETHPLSSARSQPVGRCDVHELIFDPTKNRGAILGTN